MSEGNDDFLGRWSRRKLESRDGGLRKKPESDTEPVRVPGRMITDPIPPKPEPGEALDEADAPLETAALREDAGEDQVPAVAEDDQREAERQDQAEPQPEDFEKIDFDSLNYDSDYTRFMQKGVPEAVRKRALRALWGSNPILANVDGLNDYDDDFTDAALAVKGALKTAYKPLGGYLTDEEREASYSEEARLAGREEPEDADVEEEVTEAQDASETQETTEEQAVSEQDTPEEDAPEEDAVSETASEETDDEDEDDVGEGDGDDLA